MGLKETSNDEGNIDQLIKKYPIFKRCSQYHCCVRVKGTNLLHHFTGGVIQGEWWWIASNNEWSLEEDYVDMIKYVREVNHSGDWLSGDHADVISKIPDSSIRDALLAVFKE